MKALTFNKETHEYKVGGEVRPSVSTIASSVGGIDFLHEMKATPKGRERLAWLGSYGSDIHHFIEQINSRKTDYPKCVETENYKKWVAKAGFVPIISEKPLYSHKYGYCGTFDCIGVAYGEITLIDWKSGRNIPPSDYAQTQMNLYSQLISENLRYLGIKVWNPYSQKKMMVYDFCGQFGLREVTLTRPLETTLYDLDIFMESWRKDKAFEKDGWADLKQWGKK